MYPGWMALNGIEVANSSRMNTYLKNGIAPGGGARTRVNMCGCDAITGCAEYDTPLTDQAPWVDNCAEESLDFAGLIIEEIEGLDNPFTNRQTSQSAFGGSLGPQRLNLRTVTITGWLIGKTCCATLYGLTWLTQLLSGKIYDECNGDPAVNCGLGEMQFFTCCPEDPSPYEHIESANVGKFMRVAKGVGLISGPSVIDRFGSCCSDCGSTYLQVTFTLGIENPYLYGATQIVSQDEGFLGLPVDTLTDAEKVWLCTFSCDQSQYDLGMPFPAQYSCCDEENPFRALRRKPRNAEEEAYLCITSCSQEEYERGLPYSFSCDADFNFDDSITDAQCDEPPSPPGLEISQGCYCEPLMTRRSCTVIENSCLTAEMAITMEFYSGTDSLVNMRVAAYQQDIREEPFVCPCGPEGEFVDFDDLECNHKVYDLRIPFIPYESTLKVEGASRKTMAKLGTQTEFSRQEYMAQPGSGASGGKYLMIPPGKRICLVAYADAGIYTCTSPEATWSVYATKADLVCA